MTILLMLVVMMPSKMGIYRVRNIETGRTYIGSSVNITSRLYQHKKLLANKKHQNDEMIEDYNTYGKDGFRFDVLEIVENKEFLLSREEFWIKETICAGYSVYNKKIDVGKYNRQLKRARFSLIHETKHLMSDNWVAGSLLVFFIEHMNNENRVSCTYKYMRMYFGCSETTIYRSIKYLVHEGFLSVGKCCGRNFYEVREDTFGLIKEAA